MEYYYFLQCNKYLYIYTMRKDRTKPTGNKIGSPKKYKCDIKTITISLPVDSIPAIKKFIEFEKMKYLIGPKVNGPKDQRTKYRTYAKN